MKPISKIIAAVLFIHLWSPLVSANVVTISFSGTIFSGIDSSRGGSVSLIDLPINGTLRYTLNDIPGDSDAKPNVDIRRRDLFGTTDDSGGWRIESEIIVAGSQRPKVDFSLYSMPDSARTASSVTIADGAFITVPPHLAHGTIFDTLSFGRVASLSQFNSPTQPRDNADEFINIVITSPDVGGLNPVLDPTTQVILNDLSGLTTWGSYVSNSTLENVDVRAEFELNSFSLTIVPIPAPFFLLASALGAFSLFSRTHH